MNLPIWILTGAALGWLCFMLLRGSETLGIAVSIVLGVVGGLFGGNVLAPMLGAPIDSLNEFSAFSLVVAIGAAAACLAVGNLLRHYGI